MTQEILETGTKVPHSNIFNHIKSLLRPTEDIYDLSDGDLHKFYDDHEDLWGDFILSINADIHERKNDQDAIFLYSNFITKVIDILDADNPYLIPGVSSIQGVLQEDIHALGEISGEKLSRVEKNWNSLIVKLKEYSQNKRIQEGANSRFQSIMEIHETV